MTPGVKNDIASPKNTRLQKICQHLNNLNLNSWIISNLVETNMVFFLKSFYYQWVLRIEKTTYCPVVPCPGKKVPRFAGPKKGVVPLFQMRASAVSARLSLCHRASLRRQGKGSLKSFSQPFLASAPAFFPGQQRNGSKRPTKLEMIQK